MSKQTKALKLALEALEVCQQSNYGRDWVWPDTAHPTAMANVKEAITAIREALAEQPQEPKKFDPNESFAREEAAQARVREFMRNH